MIKKQNSWTRYEIFNKEGSVLLIFFFCLRLQYDSAQHFLTSFCSNIRHHASEQWNVQRRPICACYITLSQRGRGEWAPRTTVLRFNRQHFSGWRGLVPVLGHFCFLLGPVIYEDMYIAYSSVGPRAWTSIYVGLLNWGLHAALQGKDAREAPAGSYRRADMDRKAATENQFTFINRPPQDKELILEVATLIPLWV